MALQVTISGQVNDTPGTADEFVHSLGEVPDAVFITPMVMSGEYGADYSVSGHIYLASTTPANKSVVSIAATVGSVCFKAHLIKFHSILT